ncbi:MAG: hypothetical protein ACI9S8_000367 [Chlamydiales bacterium]|jgi:hypothetical protein
MVLPINYSPFEQTPEAVAHIIFSFSNLKELSQISCVSHCINQEVKSFVKFRANVLSREMRKIKELAVIVDRQVRNLTSNKSFLIVPNSGSLAKEFTLDDQIYQRFHMIKSQCSVDVERPVPTLATFQQLHQSFKDSFVDALCSTPITILNQVNLDDYPQGAISLFQKTLERSREQICAHIALMPTSPASFYGTEVRFPPCLSNLNDVAPPITVQTAFSYCNSKTLDENNTLIRYGLPSLPPDGAFNFPITHLLLKDLLHLKEGHTLTCLWQTYNNSVVKLRVKGSQEILSGDPSIPRWATDSKFERVMKELINESIEETYLNGFLDGNPFSQSILEYGRKFLTPTDSPDTISYTFSRFDHLRFA